MCYVDGVFSDGMSNESISVVIQSRYFSIRSPSSVMLSTGRISSEHNLWYRSNHQIKVIVILSIGQFFLDSSRNTKLAIMAMMRKMAAKKSMVHRFQKKKHAHDECIICDERILSWFNFSLNRRRACA